MPPKKKQPIEVDALRHQDTRVNIPTNELRDFVGDGELNPPEMRYPRDPSLDPQLVWKGKDEQDGDDLKVLAVPIYIQEKIHPQAIIDEVKQHAKATAAPSDAPQQMDMFGDFNGIDSFDKLIQFYQHQQHWSNRMILGDSLMAMTSLSEKEGLKGQVQMIYLDPPYGIKFGSNWQVSTRKRDVKDGREEDMVRQPEQVRAFRDTWEYGIHSYLSYLRDRLVIARELLTDSGSIFVQIGDENVHLVRSLLDEVFGSENYIAQIYFKATTGRQARYLDTLANYILWYAKKFDIAKYRSVYVDKSSTDEQDIALGDLQSQGVRSTGSYHVKFAGKQYVPLAGNHWKVTEGGMQRLIKADRVQSTKNVIRFRRFPSDFPVYPLADVWTDTSGGAGADKVYVVQTATKIIERCILMTTDPGDLVLDPTMGSGTTAYVAESWGRRWITIDTSRVALALARTRLMSARFPYYLLADSKDGAQKEMELLGTIFPSREYGEDVKQGFIYERVPHITLRDIANNEEIDSIHAQWQSYLEERREWLNAELGQSWEEWQVPRELPVTPTADTSEIERVFAEYWQGRRDRQAQIDESISRNSEREILYDRPYIDNKKVRVTGPFTVESLSPHRILDPEIAQEAAKTNLANIGTYEQMVIDNLRVAGVQNTYKGERISFATLEPFAGVWLQAVGTYLDTNGDERRVAVSIGSEHGTVTARQIKEAAKESVKGVGYDLLLVCGFAFDPMVSEESKRYGKLDVQIVRMNSDLLMGSILKKTSSANLFTIFGEPDLKVEKQSDGRYVVELRGLDVYDPTTGQIRSGSTEDIACWFIDTAYNDESFFVRHAYFLGKDDAYDNLKRALKAEIDEAAWGALYSTRSMPFDRPERGTIAIKVINHYGDEVLKVYSL